MFGVLVGLLIGGFVFFTNLSYMFIAGTFLYISLVDMIPELSENKEDDSIANFLIQSFGILFGVGVMALIAIFESDIQHMFDH
ncbi:Zinc transporter foi [Brachionus plicatilis]|uniref:Zinc transporter foi n=1 Tax=Brachionus plicatilis TaxID=10195 RepID=A0A3M7RJ66_BRAPC|nr:Zinc transporter foi [Brachionus plicatilis]